MDDEKLILLVQANECLYNKYSSGYKIPEKKNNIWRNISTEMGYPEEICKRRWSCLRDRYVKEKRLQNMPSGSGAKHLPPWPLMDTMEFIAPYVVPRPMRCSSSLSSSNSLASSLSTSPPLFDVVESPPLVEILEEASSSFAPIAPSPITPAPSKRRKCSEGEDIEFSQALKAFQKLCESKTEMPKEDALDSFGKMIVGTIRTMSQTKQIEAMQKVTALVMQMKLED